MSNKANKKRWRDFRRSINGTVRLEHAYQAFSTAIDITIRLPTVSMIDQYGMLPHHGVEPRGSLA